MFTHKESQPGATSLRIREKENIMGSVIGSVARALVLGYVHDPRDDDENTQERREERR